MSGVCHGLKTSIPHWLTDDEKNMGTCAAVCSSSHIDSCSGFAKGHCFLYCKRDSAPLHYIRGAGDFLSRLRADTMHSGTDPGKSPACNSSECCHCCITFDAGAALRRGCIPELWEGCTSSPTACLVLGSLRDLCSSVFCTAKYHTRADAGADYFIKEKSVCTVLTA